MLDRFTVKLRDVISTYNEFVDSLSLRMLIRSFLIIENTIENFFELILILLTHLLSLINLHIMPMLPFPLFDMLLYNACISS